MKTCDSKLQKSVCGNNRTNFPNPLHAARSPSSLDVATQYVTNLTIRGISAGITVIPDARAWPPAAVHARRRRTLRKRGKQNKTEFARELCSTKRSPSKSWSRRNWPRCRRAAIDSAAHLQDRCGVGGDRLFLRGTCRNL